MKRLGNFSFKKNKKSNNVLFLSLISNGKRSFKKKYMENVASHNSQPSQIIITINQVKDVTPTSTCVYSKKKKKNSTGVNHYTCFEI